MSLALQFGFLMATPLDRKLYSVAHVEEHVKRTIDLRDNQHRFFISHHAETPYSIVSGDTVSRWLKNTLDLAGVNTAKFGARSTPAAKTSAAKAMNIPILTLSCRVQNGHKNRPLRNTTTNQL